MEEPRINEGYRIVSAVTVGNTEFVMGVNRRAPDMYVTWQCRGGTDYFFGHYTNSDLKATRDLCERVLEEVQYREGLWEQEKNAREQKKKDREAR